MLTVTTASGKKKASEKALIPLPPTGFAYFFCANPNVMQTHAQQSETGGLQGVGGFAQSANLRKEMNRDSNAGLNRGIVPANLRAPGYKGCA